MPTALFVPFEAPTQNSPKRRRGGVVHGNDRKVQAPSQFRLYVLPLKLRDIRQFPENACLIKVGRRDRGAESRKFDRACLGTAQLRETRDLIEDLVRTAAARSRLLACKYFPGLGNGNDPDVRPAKVER
ncbi:MAG: hypothetical protein UZ17_ACD001000803 [Acidobacteria bacterium OLB17]|nr:MAG: hypothetical protein UZ17_ACD001000803 [Acidobacteria bacterium OLB17]